MSIKKRLFLFLWWWAGLVPFDVKGQETLDFIEPVQTFMGVEYYELNEERFGIWLQRVTWDQARTLCTAYNGSLIEYLSEEMPLFIGRALAESAVVFGSLWIGGQYSKGDDMPEGEWKWVTSNTTIESKVPAGTEFPMEKYPYWANQPNLTMKSDLCLGTDRRLHHLPLIVPVNCDMLRPYICKLPRVKDPLKPTVVEPGVDVFGKKLFLFRASATWAEALQLCLDYGMQLCKITKAAEARVIQHKMMRSRPIVENAWTSGAYRKNAWMWVSSNEPINVNPNNATADEPFYWYRPNNIIPDGCLLADRHLCTHFVYVEALCNRRRSFICEKIDKYEPEYQLVQVENSSLFIGTFEATWFEAQNICRHCVDGELLHIEASEEEEKIVLPLLYAAMALTLKREIRHAWIGGYLYSKTFMWASNISIVPEKDMEITSKQFEGLHGLGKLGRLTFCDVNFGIDQFLLKYRCLNLDRENQKDFFMYGLECETKQHFICQAAYKAKIKRTCTNKANGLPVVVVDPQTD